jgi:pimeloyl-ACP methyl ester carboxylesterase
MPVARANGIDIDYDTFGSPGDPAVLLIMGFTSQKIAWDEEFCRQLAERGFFVIRFDNRDVGLSTKMDSAPPVNVAAALAGDASTAPYTLRDMADDTAGLLDAVGIGAAHVVGVSMGGMIAQCLAIQHPERVLSLTSIMSTTGSRTVGQPSADAMRVLLRTPPRDRDEAIAGAVEVAKVIGSPGFPFDEARIRERAGKAWDRGHHPPGLARQLVAILASPDRTEALRAVGVPTIVVHGEADVLVDPSGGHATAEAVPGAKLITVPGMGHDLPPGVWPLIIDAIVDNAAAATAGRSA